MPELPEVQTTVNGLNKTVRGRKIMDVWSGYNSAYFKDREEIKDRKFFRKFKRLVIGKTILKAERRAKNILIHLTGGHTILVHMKMTGHLLYEGYKKDPFNSHIRLYFTLDNGKKLYLSDLRKFAKVTVIPTETLDESLHLEDLGPEPLEKAFSFEIFKERLLKRPKGKIKQVLMDQRLISGIGNIYSDEILWRACVHPLSLAGEIPEKNLKLMYQAAQETLRRGIKLGGDSMSDYRNIYGERGKFQDHHSAYQKHKTLCTKKSPRRGGASCKGILERIVVGTRSAHFCPVHQKLYK